MNIISNSSVQIPPKQGKPMHFPELRSLKSGQCAVYPMSAREKVRSACAFIKRQYGTAFVTRSDWDADEFKVWLKPTTTKKGK